MKQIIEALMLILTAHMVGDYFLQTDYLALNKGKDNYILLVHCILYAFGVGIVFSIFGFTLTAIDLAIISAIHFPVDYLKARGITPKYTGNKNALFLDQLIHYMTIILIMII